MDKYQLFDLIGKADDAYISEEPGIKNINVAGRRKKMFAVLAAAVLLIALGVTAGAKYYFSMPKDLENNLYVENMDITSFDNDGVIPQNKTVSTCGYRVTFRAIVRGDRLNDVVMGLGDGTNIIKPREETFAIFTFEKEDGGEIDIEPLDLEYIVTMQGYEPNGLMFENFKSAAVENNTIWFACKVTDAVPFADHKLGVALTQTLVDGTVMRMDDKGDAYYMENYKGIAAQFDLPLDPAKADPEWQKIFMEGRAFNTNPDYSMADEILRLDAEFEKNGPDLSPIIGDNKWRGSYRMQFGEVEFAEIFISHRGEWKNDAIKTVSYDEANNYIWHGTALPVDADAFTLPDGTVCRYMIHNIYFCVPEEGDPYTVTAPSAHVVFKLTDLSECVSAFYMDLTCGVDNMHIDVVYPACYIDGVAPQEVGYDPAVYSEKDILMLYESVTGEFKGIQDAVFYLARCYSGFQGTVQYLP